MPVSRLATPRALVDLDVLERNASRMRGRMTRLGVTLRPHVKTHKCVEAALVQLGGAPGPVTVSTMAEARFFAGAGFTDITYAVPVAPERIAEAVELGRRVDRLALLFDHEATLAELEKAAEAAGTRIPAYLKVDCGYHRAGVDPSSQAAMALAARTASSPWVELAGILTHAGHAYHCRNPREIAGVARQERDVMVRFAEKLRTAGVKVPEVSIGSTPTMSVAESLPGVTEARPGNYLFLDAFQAAIGACTLDDCAFSVLVSVIGVYPERRAILVNAGALALSKDEGARHLDPDFGFGAVFSPDRSRHFWELNVLSLSQEHGQIAVNPPRSTAEFPVGTKLRIVPNHSCLSAALFDRFTVLRGREIVDEWRPARGW